MRVEMQVVVVLLTESHDEDKTSHAWWIISRDSRACVSEADDRASVAVNFR